MPFFFFLEKRLEVQGNTESVTDIETSAFQPGRGAGNLSASKEDFCLRSSVSRFLVFFESSAKVVVMSPADEDIRERVLKLSKLLVQAQTCDPHALVLLRKQFEVIAEWAKKAQKSEAARLASGAAELAERVMLTEYPGDNISFNVLCSSAEALREIIIDGRGSGEVAFPAFPPEP